MPGGYDADGELDEFLKATEAQAQRVLTADEGLPTYREGLTFMSLALSAMTAGGDGACVSAMPAAIYAIWGALTDELDAPGRTVEQAAAAVMHMKQAAAEWLAVVDAPDARSAYLDRWVYEECGYQRRAGGDA